MSIFFESQDLVRIIVSESRNMDLTKKHELVLNCVPDKGRLVELTPWRVIPKTKFTNTPNSHSVKRGDHKKYLGFVELTERKALFTIGKQCFQLPKTENIWLNIDDNGCANFLMLQRSPTVLESVGFSTNHTGFKSTKHYHIPPTEVSVCGNPAVHINSFDFYTHSTINESLA